MNTRRSTTRKEKGGIANERIPPCVDRVPIVGLEEDNEDVPLQEPQVPLEPQEPHNPPMPLDPFVEGDMINFEFRDGIMNFT